MVKQIAAAFGVGLLAMIVVIVVRTLSYGANQDRHEGIILPTAPSFSRVAAASHLAEAISFRTITQTPGDPAQGAEAPWLDLHDWLAETYPQSHATLRRERVGNTLSLLYTWPGSDPALAPVLLMAHQDVVPVNQGTRDDWRYPPFTGTVTDGYVMGRGAMDDKGSLIAIMEALEALAASGFSPKRTILILFGHDEEVSGSGAEAGIALLASRGVRPALVIDEGAAALAANPLTDKPISLIGIAEKGYFSVDLITQGAGGHSSMPPENSAPVRLARAITALDDRQIPAHFNSALVDGFFQASAPDMPFLMRVALSNRWLFQPLIMAQLRENPQAMAMVRTTTAPTMLRGSDKENVLAQRAAATINFRVHPEDSQDDVLAHIAKATAGIDGLSTTVRNGGISARQSPVSPVTGKPYHVLSAIADAMTEEAFGAPAPLAPFLVIGATDARYATAISDHVYRFAPAIYTEGEIAGFHGTDEKLSVANLERMIKGYARLILAMDKGD